MTHTLDDLRATLSQHADAVANTGLVNRTGSVSARVAVVRRRRRAALAGGLAAVVAAVGVGLIALPRPGEVQPADQLFRDHVGSQTLLAHTVADPGTAERTLTVDATARPLVLRSFCAAGAAGVRQHVTIDGRRFQFGGCVRGGVPSDPGSDESYTPDLGPGTHTLRIWTSAKGSASPRAFPDTTFGLAVYDGSDQVRVAGLELDRVTEFGGEDWTPDPTPQAPGRLTPDTDVMLGLASGGSFVRIRVVGPDGKDIGGAWIDGGFSSGVLLRAGTGYRISLDYSPTSRRHAARIVLYRPAD